MSEQKLQEENKRQAILQAAEEEFMRLGYAGARTTSIAKAAGVTHAMLHYYFRTKENLFQSIFEDKVQLMYASFQLHKMADPSLSLQQKLERIIGAYFDFFATHAEMPRFIINEVIPYPERLQVFQQELSKGVGMLVATIVEDYQKAVQAGEIENVPLPTLLLDMVSQTIFTFIAFPVVESVFHVVDKQAFLAHRREECIAIILRRIQRI